MIDSNRMFYFDADKHFLERHVALIEAWRDVSPALRERAIARWFGRQ
jgi:hypothetical protein